tara:strand:+ start:27 stop:848 length:822 start_codon:yes stop_codon:yes gene_type:complete
MASPHAYKLPDGNVLISFSGGRTSGYMLHQILEANGGLPERAKVVFANTGREMPETLDFVQACSDRWNVPITWVEYFNGNNGSGFAEVSRTSAAMDGQPFEQMIVRDKRLPDVVRRFCTRKLKILPTVKYLKSIGWTQWHNAVGIRADEARRIKPAPVKYITQWFPLNDAQIRKPDVAEFWGKQNAASGHDLRLTTTSNCDGCFLKSEANRAAMWRSHPDRMQWWVDMEKKVGGQFIHNQGYTQLGDFVSRQGDWIFDDEAYLCQADGGECTG